MCIWGEGALCENVGGLKVKGGGRARNRGKCLKCPVCDENNVKQIKRAFKK